MKKLILIFTAILLSACTSIGPSANAGSKIDQIELGFTKNQVLQLLGEPKSVTTVNGFEYLYYTKCTDKMWYLGERCTMWGEEVIKLESDKVIAKGRSQDLI